MASADLLDLDRATPVPTAQTRAEFEVRVWHRLEDAATAWDALTVGAIESPGQVREFIRLWIDAFVIAEANQFYVAAFENGEPVALLPLHRCRRMGVSRLSWFPGPHVGCNAPLIDGARLAAMTPARRKQLWTEMLHGIDGADLVHLKSVPRLIVDGVEVFAELGQMIEADTLYRASFVSFEEADRTQRTRSRRKHDRQQGDKLAAMGTIEFDELDNGPEAERILDVMFRQRAARFREMGVFDPFAEPEVRAFYDASARVCSGVHVKLYVLKLKGEVVALRYNIVHGDRLFCLISSMSEAPELRPGSPGKQCLLRVMQTAFAEGYRVFDMGEGLTDEKRHWCNVEIPVRHHYLPITPAGHFAATAHRGANLLKARVKSNPQLLAAMKRVRGMMAARRANAPDAADTAD